jgi:glutamate-1-semialdehyde aminotransferase
MMNLVRPDRVHTSIAHTEQDIAETLATLERVFQNLA